MVARKIMYQMNMKKTFNTKKTEKKKKNFQIFSQLCFYFYFVHKSFFHLNTKTKKRLAFLTQQNGGCGETMLHII